MERARQFVSACLAGIMIGIGGTVYLSIADPVVGSFLFGLGLFTIVVFGLHLFTGKIGYLPMQKPIYLLEISITWLGNLTGTFLVAQAVRNTRIFPKLARVQAVVQAKLDDTLLSILFLSFFCGLLMFIAVDTYKTCKNPTAQVFAIFLPVMVFILSGFEHVVANMFYFSLACAWSTKALGYILLMTIGNALGGIAIPLYKKIFSL